MPAPTLRQLKRERTRRAIVDAAVALFEQRGYERTTVADIAGAAEIGTRTFFGYFPSKEDVLFPEADGRVRAVVDALAERGPADGPGDVLLRALRDVDATGHDMVGRQAALRMRLIRTVPAVRGRGLQIQHDAQREIARLLVEAFPDDLDDVLAGALVGAFVGAVTGAVEALLDRADAADEPSGLGERRAALIEATERALRPWALG